MNLSPVQFILWIAGVELISAPVIVATVTAIINGYFKAKEEHVGKMLKATGEVIGKMGSDWSANLLKKKEEADS